MKKKAVVIAMAAALAVSQYAAVFAANSPGTGVMIPNEDSDGDYDIGERVDQVTGGSSSASGTGNSSAATPIRLEPEWKKQEPPICLCMSRIW